MNEMIECLLGILFPRRCPVCQNIVQDAGELVCVKCRKKLHFIREPLCKRCGKPLLSDQVEFCRDCEKNGHFYDRGRAVFLYEGEIKEAVQALKYDGKREYAQFFIEMMAACLGNKIKIWNPQAVIPIPMYWKKQQKRGYNQAELLAKGLAECLYLPFSKKVLKKVRDTDSQKELSRAGRKQNLKNAFKFVESDVKLKTVLLVDDVYTTGSTIDAAAQVLKENGIEKVYFISICIGKGAG